MSRDDLLLTNMRITSAVTEEVVKHSPDCIILAVTNPLDAMVQNVYQTGWVPAQPRVRHGRRPRHRPVPHVHRPGAQRLC